MSQSSTTGNETVSGIVQDSADALQPGTLQLLSLTTDGRLRVVTFEESFNLSPWGDPEQFRSNMQVRTLNTWPLT